MNTTEQESTQNSQNTDTPKPLKACCACKPTRTLRDECIRNFNEEKCVDFIEAHKECLREKGFKVE